MTRDKPVPHLRTLPRRPWALPLVPLYWLGLRLESAFAPRPKQLRAPVLSVGSLSAGGAGKTPVVKLLATLLQQEGFPVNVLSRGYGRDSGAIAAVNPAGPATRFGDEPLELARAGLSVFVGADRHAAGLLAEATIPAAIHLLDDGFQHRRLARTLDLVLITLADVNDTLLPAGNLREPLSALHRAHLFLVRAEEEARLRPITQRFQTPVWVIERTLRLPPDQPARPLAFCGIARPESFWTMLGKAGLHLAGRIAFPDHHAYTARDVESLRNAAQQAGADAFVTTAKDSVKLTPALCARLEQVGPVIVAELHLSLRNQDACLRFLREKLHS